MRLPSYDSDMEHTLVPDEALLRIAPDVDLGQFDLDPFQLMVAKALQKYGVYVDGPSFDPEVVSMLRKIAFNKDSA